jgi:hypothetical protein
MRSAVITLPTLLVSTLLVLALAGAGCTTPKPKPRPARRALPKDTTAVSQKTMTPEQMEEVQTLVRQGTVSLNRCYQKELEEAKKPFRIKIVVKFLVGTAAHVTKVAFALSTTDSATFKSCITKTIKGWEFPKLKTEAWFTYPFTFEPAY